MSDLERVTVLGWTLPRPTGRWHQSIVVTARHVWLTPELTFGDNEALTHAAAAGIDAFHDYVKGAGWKTRPPRLVTTAVSGVDWNATTGLIRIANRDGDVIGAMVPDRARGGELEQELRVAIRPYLLNQTGSA